MTKSEIFKAAHKLTKEIIKATDNYSATFGLCLTFIYSNHNLKSEQMEITVKEKFEKFISEVKTTEITVGSEKQISWAISLRQNIAYQIERKVKTEIKKSWKSIEVAERIAYSSILDLHKNADLSDARFYIQNR